MSGSEFSLDFPLIISIESLNYQTGYHQQFRELRVFVRRVLAPTFGPCAARASKIALHRDLQLSRSAWMRRSGAPESGLPVILSNPAGDLFASAIGHPNKNPAQRRACYPIRSGLSDFSMPGEPDQASEACAE